MISLLGVCVAGGLSACSAAPSQDVLGSFFPSWLLCAFIGVAAAAVCRQLLGLAGLNDSLIAPPLTYLAIVVAVSLLVWLIWFGG